MKTFLSISLFICLSFSSETQKTEKLINGSLVSYQLDESSNKQGAYKLSNSKGLSKLQGAFKSGVRSGDWYGFDDSGKIIFRYNYSVQKLLSLDSSQSVLLSVKFPKNVSEGLLQTPTPICPIDEMKSIIAAELESQIPDKLKGSPRTFDAIITILVGKDGKAKYLSKYVVEGYEYKTSIDPDSKAFNIDWIPAKADGSNVSSEVSFNLSFKVDPGNSRRFLWNF